MEAIDPVVSQGENQIPPEQQPQIDDRTPSKESTNDLNFHFLPPLAFRYFVQGRQRTQGLVSGGRSFEAGYLERIHTAVCATTSHSIPLKPWQAYTPQ